MEKDIKEGVESEGVLPRLIKIDEQEVQSHVDRLVKQTVAEMLNRMIEEEADRLCQARRYERSDGRRDTRAGYYKRKLHVKAGEVEWSGCGKDRLGKAKRFPKPLALASPDPLSHISSSDSGLPQAKSAKNSGHYLEVF